MAILHNVSADLQVKIYLFGLQIFFYVQYLMFVSSTCYFVGHENESFKLCHVNSELSIYFKEIDEIEYVLCAFGVWLHF